jgi:hypothetical protein
MPVRNMTLEQIERKNKVFLSATVDPGIKEAIDEVKGILSRSQYVQQAIMERVARDRSSSKKK